MAIVDRRIILGGVSAPARIDLVRDTKEQELQASSLRQGRDDSCFRSSSYAVSLLCRWSHRRSNGGGNILLKLR